MGRNRKKPVRHRLEKRQKRSRQKKKSGLFDKVTMVVLVVAVCVFAFSALSAGTHNGAILFWWKRV